MTPDEVKEIKEAINRVGGDIEPRRPYSTSRVPLQADSNKICAPVLAERISHFSDISSKNLPNKSEKNGSITLPHRLNRLHSYPQPSRTASEKDPVIEDLKKVSIKERIAQYNSVAQKVDSPITEAARDVGRKTHNANSPFLATPVRDEEAVVHENDDQHDRMKHEKEMRRHKYADISPKLNLQSSGDIFVGKMIGLDVMASPIHTSDKIQKEPEHETVGSFVESDEELHKTGSHCELALDATISTMLSSANCPSRLDDISLDSDYLSVQAPPFSDPSEMPCVNNEDRCRLAKHTL
jgi:hypothetical protein